MGTELEELKIWT